MEYKKDSPLSQYRSLQKECSSMGLSPCAGRGVTLPALEKKVSAAKADLSLSQSPPSSRVRGKDLRKIKGYRVSLMHNGEIILEETFDDLTSAYERAIDIFIEESGTNVSKSRVRSEIARASFIRFLGIPSFEEYALYVSPM
jgi:hypothetical protein